MTKLTVKSIAKAIRHGEPCNVSDANSLGGVRGLRLVVSSKRAASWELRYERHGRERVLGLGSVRDIPLKEARERARRARQQIMDGHDPLDAKRAAKAAQVMADARTLTFEDAAHLYFEAFEHSWKNRKHRLQFLSTLKAYVFPRIGKLPVGEIDTPLVIQCLKPIWATKTETANRVRARIEKVLGWATVNGFRAGDNPARWRDNLKAALPPPSAIAKVQHHAAVSIDDLPLFMTELRQREGVAAQALEFTILTAARTGETIGATWAETDLKTKTWTVPANRIKGGKEHKVPLSDRALELLKTAFTEDGADDTAKQERMKAHDPQLSPDPRAARAAMEDAEFAAARLRTTLPRLQQRHQEVAAKEYLAQWQENFAVLKSARDDLAAELKDFYPDAAAQLVSILNRCAALDASLSRLHQARPSGVAMHLLSAELEARNLDAHTAAQPAIVEVLKLPDWSRSDQMVWPPKTPSLASFVMPAPPAGLAEAGQDWWRLRDQRAAELRRENARVGAHYAAEEREREARQG